MCKGMPGIPINRVVDTKRIIKQRRAKKEERHQRGVFLKTSVGANSRLDTKFAPR
jgi:hypothetical protein